MERGDQVKLKSGEQAVVMSVRDPQRSIVVKLEDGSLKNVSLNDLELN